MLVEEVICNKDNDNYVPTIQTLAVLLFYMKGLHTVKMIEFSSAAGKRQDVPGIASLMMPEHKKHQSKKHKKDIIKVQRVQPSQQLELEKLENQIIKTNMHESI